MNIKYRDFTGNLFVILIMKEDFAEEKVKLLQEGGIALKGGGGLDIAFYKIVWQIWSLFGPR